MPISKLCENCGKVIERGRDHKAFERARFCCPECYWASLKGKKLRYKKELHKKEYIFCACGCGQLIPKFDKRHRKRKYVIGHTAIGRKIKFSKEWLEKVTKANIIKGKLHKGKNHWNWKGGKTSKNHRIRRSKEYKEWRLAVYARDHYTCQDCGTHCTSKTIVAHHLKSFNDYPELRFKVDNGITLCRSCHKKWHKEIGLKTRFKKLD